MTHNTTGAARYVVAAGPAAALLSMAGGSVLAGEITGNGTLKEVHGRSACAYSGQEDLQFFYDDGDTLLKATPTNRDPGHAQSWGRSTRPRATS